MKEGRRFHTGESLNAKSRIGKKKGKCDKGDQKGGRRIDKVEHLWKKVREKGVILRR